MGLSSQTSSRTRTTRMKSGITSWANCGRALRSADRWQLHECFSLTSNAVFRLALGVCCLMVQMVRPTCLRGQPGESSGAAGSQAPDPGIEYYQCEAPRNELRGKTFCVQ